MEREDKIENPAAADSADSADSAQFTTMRGFLESVRQHLDYTPNEQQRLVLEALARFVSPARARQAEAQRSQDRVFVLNGYAGTGKTSLTAALVKALRQARVHSVLLAPTGRAAKVFSAFAGYPAYTIHRRIYRHSINGEVPAVQTNPNPDTVFVVDEASMISGDDPYGNTNLLLDLVQYVFSAPGCRMILLGDTAQLPPVGSEFSPAMDTDTLRSLGLTVSRAVLTAIARQGALSGILANATMLRRNMKLSPLPQPRLILGKHPDVKTVSPVDLAEEIDGAYRRDGIENTLIVTRSNRRAADYNRAVRAQVLYLEEEVARGEMLIICKNNYFWSKGVKGLDFIANGDNFAVVQVYNTEIRYGLRFANVRLALPDNDAVNFEAKIMLDTLANDYVGISPEHARYLYAGILADAGLPDVPGPQRTRLLRENPYWNALQVKYGYAVTCHKAQGGQWSNVFVDMVGIAPDAMGMEFYRWLYTATTRARTRLFFVAPEEN